MQGAKESRSLLMKLSNAHSRVGKKSLTKQNCFKKNHWESKTSPHCTRCSQTSQPLWNAVSIAVRPEWLVDPRWPPHFNKAFGTSQQQYWHGWLEITNCPSREPASMAHGSHKECLHHCLEEIHSSFLPCSSRRPAEKAFKLERTHQTQTGRSPTHL